jgi:hypothetical protein
MSEVMVQNRLAYIMCMPGLVNATKENFFVNIMIAGDMIVERSDIAIT